MYAPYEIENWLDAESRRYEARGDQATSYAISKLACAIMTGPDVDDLIDAANAETRSIAGKAG
jgi:hypothetical protein